MKKDLKIVSFNIEGFSQVKADIVASMNVDIVCLQETHRDSKPATISGMKLAIETRSPVYGSAIFVKDPAFVQTTENISTGSVELLKVEMDQLTIISVYKPPSEPFIWPQNVHYNDKACLIIGDFNSHSTMWGYSETNEDGGKVEEWAFGHNLTLLYDSKDACTFHSARWGRGYNPDLTFVTDAHAQHFRRTVSNHVPKSQHRPVLIEIKPLLSPRETKYMPRFNFRKADWPAFTTKLEHDITTTIINSAPNSYDEFTKLVWKVAKETIPRGCRKQYIPCLTDESSQLYGQYTKLYDRDPLGEDTVNLGEVLMNQLSEERQSRWMELIKDTDLTHNSKKAWSTIKKLRSEDQPKTRIAAVTANQVAHQLLLNGKPAHKEKHQTKEIKTELNTIIQQSQHDNENFTIGELERALATLKPNKAAGLDGLTNEFLLHFGPGAKSWLLALFNDCMRSFVVPKIWKRARVVALLKPQKDPMQPKSYRPISLLCTTFKLYERMLLSRLAPTIEDQLTPDQAGFRPGRSCCGQVLNLTQYIEDGYEHKLITGAVFVDLSAAYDTINHRALLLKLARMVKNAVLIKAVMSLLSNRRFFVELDGKRSRWRVQRNGLPQGSVLAPLLFNVYTNDQPSHPNIRRFIYADDLCIATQSKSFGAIEERLSDALVTLGDYYKRWSLNANPGKTQICAFHLNNQAANRTLDISWNGVDLQHYTNPVYLGVCLDRTLSFSNHIKKLKGKLGARNNLLSKLSNTKWGTNPQTLKQTALALCYSTAEYCAPVWARSCHANKVDPELNQACRMITGTLKPTPVALVYQLASIPPPSIRRETMARVERTKQLTDSRHPLHNHDPVRRRLKSRNSFATIEPLPPNVNPAVHRLSEWKKLPNTYADQYQAVKQPSDQLPEGSSLQRKDWCTLNRARTRVGMTNAMKTRWGYATDPSCQCGYPSQTMKHILRDCHMSLHCTDKDLLEASDYALAWIAEWRDKI